MPNIDERVVKMTFDNQQFEKGVSQSLKTIDDLKKALELDKMGESLKGLESATAAVNSSLTSIEQNAQRVANVFSPIGRVIQHELDQIADSAIRATKEIAAWTTGLAGLSAGQAKYEAYTKAVQTITNATGKSVKDVGVILNKLSKYTDETSYDFSSMVDNIGKFTSVGVELERAEAAMEGIANWAAKSGAGKQAANRAMYNISQAMGTGSMMIRDWMSIENANMATKEFKEIAIETAKELGTLAETGEYAAGATAKNIVNFQTFRETLRDGWLTADVLTKTLEKYADTTTDFGLAAFHAAQEALTFTDAIEAVKDAVSSGWMRTMEALFGNLDEARVMWTNVANALIEFAEIFSETRNELLQGWHEMGGYNVMVEAASNIWQTFMNVVLGVKEALEQVFPPATAENLLAITNKLKWASEDLLSAFGVDFYEEFEETYTKVYDYAEALTSVLKKGAKGEEVKALQEQLIKAGYLADKASADGIYGPKTQAAVEKLQKELGVNVTGVWDDVTRKATITSKKFNGLIKDTRTVTKKNTIEVKEEYDAITNHMAALQKDLSRGVKNDTVKKLQEQLIRTGFLADKAGADGIYGPKTEEAVKKLQSKLGVTVTGVWDKVTRDAVITSQLFNETIKQERTVYQEVQGLTGPMERVQGIVRGIASALKIAWSILKSGFEVAKRVIKIFDPLFAVLTRFGAMFGEMGKNLSDRLEDADAFEGVVYRITAALEPFARFVENISYSLEDFLDMYSTFLAAFDLENNIGNFFSFVIGYLKRFTILGPVINFVESVVDAVTWLVATIKNLVVGLATWLMDEFTYLFLEGGLSDIIIRSYENNGIVAALLEIFNSAAYIVDMIISLIAGIYEAAFPPNQNVDGEKTGLAKVFDGIKTAILVAANAMAFALSMLAQGITLVVQVLGPFFIPALILATQLIANLSKRFAKGEVTSLPGFFMALGRSFAETDTGAKILGTITNRLSKFVEAIKTFINTNFPGLIDTLGKKWESVKNFFSFDKDKTFGENIKSKLEEIKKWFETTIASIKETIQNAFSAIGVDFERVKSLFTYNKDKTFLDNVKDKLVILKDIVAGTVTFILNKFAEIGAGIAQSFTKDENGNIPIFENLKRKIGEIREFISKVISGAGEVSGESSPFIEAIKANLENLRIIITGILDYIWTKLKEFAQAIAAQFTRDENGNLPIFDTLKSKLSAFEPVVDWFISLKDRLIEGFKELTGIGSEGNTPEVGKGFTSVLDKIKELAGNFKNTDIGKMILPIIGGFVGVQLFKTFASVKNIAKTFDEGGIIAVLAGRQKEEDGAVDKIVKIAGSLVAMSLALGLLSIVNYEKVEKGLKDLGLAIAGILGGSWLSGKVGIGATNLGETLKNVGDGLLSIVKAIGTLTVIMLLVNTFDSIKEAFEDAKSLVITIGGILLGLEVGFSILDTVLSHFRGMSISITEKSTIIKDICDGLLNIAWSIAIVTAAVHFLGKDEAYQAAGIITVMTIVLGVIAGAMEKLAGNKLVSVRVGGFVSMCAGVLLLSFAYTNVLNALKDIKEDDWGKVWAALGIIGAFLGAIAAISFITNNGSHPIAAIFQIVAMGAALILFVSTLGKVIKEIKDVNPELLKWFAVALVGGLLAITAAIAVFGALKLKTFIGEAGFLALMLVLALGVEILGNVTGSTLNNFVKYLRNIGYNLESFSNSVGKVNWESVNKATEWLKNGPIEIFKALGGSYVNATAASAAMDELYTIAIMIYNYSSFLAKAGKYGMIGSVMAIAMMRLAQEITNAAQSVTVPDNLINGSLNEMAASILIYSALISSLPTEDRSSTAISLAKNAKEISDAINAITLNDSAARSLVLVGAALELYYAELADIGKVGVDGEALENPFDVSKIQIDSETIASVMQGLAKAIPEDANETISAYGPDGSNDLAGFAAGLTALADALKIYGEKTKDINNNGQIDAANQALEGVTGIDEHLWSLKDQFENSDAFFTEYIETITKFSNGITILGGALQEYGNLTKNLDATKIKNANDILDEFVKLDNYFNNGNILTRIFNGFESFFEEVDNTIGKSLFDIATFGNVDIKDFAKKVEIVDGQVKEIEETVDDTSEEGKTGKIDKLTLFSIQIQKFGQALKTYSDSISGIGEDGKKSFSSLKDNETSIKIANELLDHFVAISEAIPKMGGLISHLTGDSSLSEYGNGIRGLGEELRKFQAEILDLDHDGANALDASKLEVGFAAMERIMSWGKQFFDDNALGNDLYPGMYDMKFNRVVEGIISSVEALGKLSNQKVGDTDLSQVFMDTGSMILDMIGDGIEKAESENNNLSSSIKDTIKIGVQNAYNNFLQGVNESNGILLNGIGKNIVLAIAKGIKNEENANNPIKQNIESLIVHGVNLISNNLKEFIKTGKFVDEGFRIGILGDSDGIIKALQTLALKLIEAFTKVLEVESPSRKFEWIAHMCALGLKLGFDKYSYLVTDSSADLANMSVEAIAASFDSSKASKIAEGAIEAIHKILYIPKNGILTKDQKTAIREMLNFSGYITEDDYYNGKKMVAAIKKFKEEVLGLENTNGTVYNSTIATLMSVINDQLEDSPYDAIAYEKEMIASLGKQYETTANTIIENNEKVAESNKKVEKDTTEKTKKSKKFNYDVGNVDLYNRPLITAQEMQAAGWKDFKEGIATLYSSSYTIGSNKKKNKAIVDITPITASGKVLSPDMLDEYVSKLENSGKDILEADKIVNGGLGLVLRRDVFRTGSGNRARQKSEQWTQSLHEDQAEFYEKQIAAAEKMYEETGTIGRHISKSIIDTDKRLNATDYGDWLEPGNQGGRVVRLQKYLNSLSTTTEKISENGAFGASTSKVIKNLQKILGVDQTGKWDKATYRALKQDEKYRINYDTKGTADPHKEGDTGLGVKWLQEYLNSLTTTTEKIAVDGKYTAATTAAVLNLQRRLGIGQTGNWDKETINAIKKNDELLKRQNEVTKDNNALNKEEKKINKDTKKLHTEIRKTLKKGDRGDEVKALQQYLNSFDTITEKLVVDGIFGSKTAAAVSTLQKQYGLDSNGEWGEELLDKLVDTEETKKSKEEEKRLKHEADVRYQAEKKRREQENVDAILRMQKLLRERGYLTEGTYTVGQLDEVTQAALKVFARDIGYGEYDPTKIVVDPEAKANAEEAERKAKEYYTLADQAAKRGDYTLASKYAALAKEAVDLQKQLEEKAYDYVSKNAITNSLPINNDFDDYFFGEEYNKIMEFINSKGGLDNILTENTGSTTATDKTRNDITRQVEIDESNNKYLEDVARELEDQGFLTIIGTSDDEFNKYDHHRSTTGKSVARTGYVDAQIENAMRKRNFYIYGEEDPSKETIEEMNKTIVELYGSIDSYLLHNHDNIKRIADAEGKSYSQVQREMMTIVEYAKNNRRYRNIYGDATYNNHPNNTTTHIPVHMVNNGLNVPNFKYRATDGQAVFIKPNHFSIDSADYDFWNSMMEGAGYIAAKNHYDENGHIDFDDFSLNQAAFVKMIEQITGFTSWENYEYRLSEQQAKIINRLLNEFGGWAGVFAHIGKSYNPGFKYEGSWMNGGAVSEDAKNSFLSYWNGTEDPRRMNPNDKDPLKTIREALGLIGDDGTTEGGGLFDPIYSSVEELTKSLTSEGGLVDVCKSTATDALTELLGTRDGGNGIIGGMFSSLPDVFEGGLEIGKNICEGVLEGIKQYTSPVLTELLGLSQDGQEEMEDDNKIASPSQVYFDYGAMLMLGLQRGIVSRRDPLLQAIRVISSSMQYAFRLANGINEGISTDYQSLGETIVNSIIQGLENRKDSLIQKLAEISSIALGNATMTVSSLDEAIKNNDEGNTNTIRPIITGGSGETNPIIGNAILGISTNVANANIIATAIQNDIKDLKTSVDNEHRTLISQFDNLNVHLDNIDRDILNMKLYLDGNTLVGGIVGRMDTALGQRRFRAGGRR